MRRTSVLVVALLASAITAPRLQAQTPERDAPLPAEVIASWQSDRSGPIDQRGRSRREIVRFGGSYALAADEVVKSVLVVGGDVTVAGQVEQEVAVIFGHVTVASTASINGDFLVVGGGGKVEEGARVRRDVAIVGATLDAPANFSSSANSFVLDPRGLGGWVEGLFAWLTRGLVWGRLIVPSLAWVWAVVATLFLLYLLLGVLFEKPISAAVSTLQARPLSSLMVGVLVMLLLGPVCALLAVSIVGIAVIPLVIVGVIVAGILGKVASTRWLGNTVLRGDETEGRAVAVRAFVVGSILLVLVYMVPVLGLAAWTMSGMFGLGATALAFMAAYRRENPLPVRPPAPIAAPRPAAFGPTFVSGDAVNDLPLAAALPEGGAMPISPEPTSVSFDQPGSHARVVPAGDLALFPRAAFLERAASGVLDLILIVVLTQLFLERAPERFVMMGALAYFVGFWAWKGATVGGIICQLRVVRVDGSPLRFADALVRALSGFFSLIVVGLGFLWILKDSERQAWHDRIAGTYVVKVPRNYPI